MEKVFEVEVTESLKGRGFWMGIFRMVAKEIWKTNVFFTQEDMSAVMEASLISFEEFEKEVRPGQPNCFLLFMMACHKTFRTRIIIKTKKPALRLEVTLKGNLSRQIESISCGFGSCVPLNYRKFLDLQEIIYRAQDELEEKIKTG